MSERSVLLRPEVVSCREFSLNTLGRMRKFERRRQEKLDRLAREKRESAEKEMRLAGRRVARDDREKEAVLMSAVTRLDHMIRVKEEKLERERLSSLKAKRDRVLDECTFQPKTTSRSSSLKRGLDDLLNWKSNLLKKNLTKKLEQAQINYNTTSRATALSTETSRKSVAETIDRLYKQAFTKKSLRQSGEETGKSRSRRASQASKQRRDSLHLAGSRYFTGNPVVSQQRESSESLSLKENSDAFKTPAKESSARLKPARRDHTPLRDTTLQLSSQEANYLSLADSSVGALLQSESPRNKPSHSRNKQTHQTRPAEANKDNLDPRPAQSKPNSKQIKFKKVDKTSKPTVAHQASPPSKHAAGNRKDANLKSLINDATNETLAQIQIQTLPPTQPKNKSLLFKEGDTRTTKTSNEQDLRKNGLLGTLDRMIDTSIKRDTHGKSLQTRRLQLSKNEATFEAASNSTLPRRDSKSPEKEDPSGIQEIGIRDFISNLDHDPQRELAKRRSESKSRVNRSKLHDRIETIFSKDNSSLQHKLSTQTQHPQAEDLQGNRLT